MQEAPNSCDQEQAALLELLEDFAANRARIGQLPEDVRKRLLAACGRLIGASKGDLRQERRSARSQAAVDKRERKLQALRNAALRRIRSDGKINSSALPAHALPLRATAEREASQLESQLRQAHVETVLEQPHACYICKAPYTQVHFFYDSMCKSCGDFNFQKRSEFADLSGRVALVTGGRVKIGQEIVLKLLRCGAHVIVTTRFAADAARRYAEREDFAEYQDRLQIYGLDLRHTPSI